MDLFDTHAHLTDSAFAEDLSEVLERARSAGVAGILITGTDLDDSRAAAALASKNGFLAGVGVHPELAGRLSLNWEEELEGLILDVKPVAIGECGLDRFHPDPPLEKQIPVFRAQVRLAKKHHLPIVIHSRRAGWEALKVLEEEGALPDGGVFHCAESDEVLALTVAKAGFHIGVGGTLTYPRNDLLRKLLAKLPSERILIETDCPYLTPQPERGKRNEPAFVAHVAVKMAEVLGIKTEEVARLTTVNARRLFCGAG